MFKDYETRCLLGSSKKVTARSKHIQGSLLMILIFLDPLIFYVSRNRFVNLFPVFPNLFLRGTTVRASLAIIWFSTQSTPVFVQSLNLSVILRRLKFAGHPEHGVASSSLIFSVISLERTRPGWVGAFVSLSFPGYIVVVIPLLIFVAYQPVTPMNARVGVNVCIVV